MKRIITILAIIFVTAVLTNTSRAGHHQVAGVVVGGATGAIVGQAIGTNTESTIIGATVGSMVGLLATSVGHGHPQQAHYAPGYGPFFYPYPYYGYYPRYRQGPNHYRGHGYSKKNHYRRGYGPSHNSGRKGHGRPQHNGRPHNRY